MTTRIHYSDDRNPHDPYAYARKQAVAWACGTLRNLDIPFEYEDGVWYVCAFWGWETAETSSEISRIARQCEEYVRDMNRFEGPIQ